MGEFAGYALEEVMDHEEDRLRYKLGNMSDYEAYDLGIIDSLGYEYSPWSGTRSLQKAIRGRSQVKSTHCKYCGHQNLFWKLWENNKWRLFESRAVQPHSCIKYKPVKDE